VVVVERRGGGQRSSVVVVDQGGGGRHESIDVYLGICAERRESARAVRVGVARVGRLSCSERWSAVAR
jgi:hypothetical protein